MAVIEWKNELRARKCEGCGKPFGKWTCCEQAFCNTCVQNHWDEQFHKDSE